MNKKQALYLLLWLSMTPSQWTHTYQVTLDTAKSCDGYFITGTDYELMHIFQSKIREQLQVFAEWAEKESGLKSDAHYQATLRNEKHNLIKMAFQYFGYALNARPVLVRLIEEDCKKRDIHNSILLAWSKSPSGQEESVFDVVIKDFKTLINFCNELVQFIDDFMHSCPKAQQQFKNNLAKWHALKDVLKNLLHEKHIFLDQAAQDAFCRYVKKNHFEKLSLTQITPEKVSSLLAIFNESRK
jgi:hypothetical protein